MRDNSSDFALRERLLIQYGDKYYPVKKYAVDLSELSDANKQHYITDGKKWYLTLRGLFREHTEQQASLERSIPKQDLCLIITIRDPNRIAPIYNDVTQGLDNYHFWHSNIKLTNDVTVNVWYEASRKYVRYLIAQKEKERHHRTHFDPMMALPFCLNVKIRRFPYEETLYRPTWEIILPLHGKAATGGFFAHFEP